MTKESKCRDPRNCGRHHCGCNRHIPLTQGECNHCRPSCYACNKTLIEGYEKWLGLCIECSFKLDEGLRKGEMLLQ